MSPFNSGTTKRVYAYIPKDLSEYLDDIATANETSVSGVITSMLSSIMKDDLNFEQNQKANGKGKP